MACNQGGHKNKHFFLSQSHNLSSHAIESRYRVKLSAIEAHYRVTRAIVFTSATTVYTRAIPKILINGY